MLGVTPEGTWAETDGSGGELGEGWWALPGLADAHIHLAGDDVTKGGEPEAIRRRAFACLERGTFLVVDKGWSDDSVIATLRDIPPRERPIYEAAGRIIAGDGGYYPGFGIETDAEGLAKVVTEMIERGDGWVKLIGDWPRRGQGAVANFDYDALVAAVDVAHRGGARLAIHTMAPEVPSAAVAAGVDSIEHGLFLTLEDLEALEGRSGAWVPTVLRMEQIVDMLGTESSGGRLIAGGLDNVSELLPVAPQGLAILAGTDIAVDPGGIGHEAVALTRRGLPPQRAVDAASAAAGGYLGRPTGFEVGQAADAVFFDADPYGDPSALLTPAAVMRRGERIA